MRDRRSQNAESQYLQHQVQRYGSGVCGSRKFTTGILILHIALKHTGGYDAIVNRVCIVDSDVMQIVRHLNAKITVDVIGHFHCQSNKYANVDTRTWHVFLMF